MPKNAMGDRQVISAKQGIPTNMEGVNTVDLPDGDYLTIISKSKEYPAHKIAKAIVAGQINLNDIKGAK